MTDKVKRLREALEKNNRLLDAIISHADNIKPVEGEGDNRKGHIKNIATGIQDLNYKALAEGGRDEQI